jgi:hypothetical protein
LSKDGNQLYKKQKKVMFCVPKNWYTNSQKPYALTLRLTIKNINASS